MPAPEQDTHGIGKLIRRLNREYQNQFNTTTEVITDTGSDWEINIPNTTVSHPDIPKEPYDAAISGHDDSGYTNVDINSIKKLPHGGFIEYYNDGVDAWFQTAKIDGSRTVLGTTGPTVGTTGKVPISTGVVGESSGGAADNANIYPAVVAALDNEIHVIDTVTDIMTPVIGQSEPINYTADYDIAINETYDHLIVASCDGTGNIAIERWPVNFKDFQPSRTDILDVSVSTPVDKISVDTKGQYAMVVGHVSGGSDSVAKTFNVADSPTTEVAELDPVEFNNRLDGVKINGDLGGAVAFDLEFHNAHMFTLDTLDRAQFGIGGNANVSSIHATPSEYCHTLIRNNIVYFVPAKAHATTVLAWPHRGGTTGGEVLWGFEVRSSSSGTNCIGEATIRGSRMLVPLQGSSDLVRIGSYMAYS